MVIPDKIIRSHRRSISLTITDKGELYVRAPMRLAYDKIYGFIKEKERWIIQKQSEIETKNQFNKDVITYKKILFLGKKYNVNYLDGLKKIELSDTSLIVPKQFYNNTNKIKNWFVVLSKDILKERLEYWANIMQLDYSSITINNNKTRWGSCDSERNIKLNFRLIMLPHKVVDYVLIHELTHILEMNHSKSFYKIITKIMPSYKLHQKILKENGYLLSLYR